MTRQTLIAVWVFWAIRVAADKVGETYPVKDWLVWELGTVWVLTLIFATSVSAIGHRILASVFRQELPLIERLALSPVVGLIAFAFVMYVLGAAHLYNLTAAIVVPLAFLGLGLRGLIRTVHEYWKCEADDAAALPLATRYRADLLARAALVFGLVSLGILYLPLISPSSLNYDSVWCHLTVGQDYAHAGRIVPFHADYARNMPQMVGLVNTWGYLFPQVGSLQIWILPLHFEFVVVLAELIGIAAVIRHLLGDRRVAYAWAFFFLFPAIFVYDMNIGGSADHYLALFCAPLFLAASRTYQAFEFRRLALFAVLAGGALLTKYQGIYLVLACAPLPLVAWLKVLYAAIRRRVDASARGAPAWHRLVLFPVGAVLLMVMVVGPHLTRNYLFHNNPVYPFAQDVFASSPNLPGASAEVEHLFKDFAWRPVGTLPEKAESSLSLLTKFAFEPHYSWTRNWPNFGLLFTLGLPLLLLVSGSQRLWWAALVAVAALFVWGMTFRVDRNLQGIVPIVVAVTGTILVRAWQAGRLARVGVATLVGFQVVAGGDALFYSQKGRLIDALNIVTSGYDLAPERRTATRKEFLDLDSTLPPNAKVLFHQEHGTLGLRREIIKDIPGHQGLVNYSQVKGARGMYELYRNLGITHVMYYPYFPRSLWNHRDDVLFQEFVRAATPDARSGFELVDVGRMQRPPPDPEQYLVYVRGVHGYGSGIYNLQDLDVDHRLRPDLQKYPEPREPFTDDANVQADMLARAHAIVGAISIQWSDIEKKMLAERFKLVKRYDGPLPAGVTIFLVR